VGETSTNGGSHSDAPLIEPNQSQVTNTFSGATLSPCRAYRKTKVWTGWRCLFRALFPSATTDSPTSNGGMGFSSNGLRGRNNDQQIDGQNNNDNSVAGPGLFVADGEFVQQYILVHKPVCAQSTGAMPVPWSTLSPSPEQSLAWQHLRNENNSVLNSMSNFQKNYDVDVAAKPLTKPPRLNDEFTGFHHRRALGQEQGLLFWWL